MDPKIISYGTVIYIPSIKGKEVILPNGKKVIHDGYLFAGDTGSAILDNHIDTFTGIVTTNPFPNIITSDSLRTLTAYILTDASLIGAMKSLHIK